jgi:hypothetical protein
MELLVASTPPDFLSEFGEENLLRRKHVTFPRERINGETEVSSPCGKDHSHEMAASNRPSESSNNSPIGPRIGRKGDNALVPPRIPQI